MKSHHPQALSLVPGDEFISSAGRSRYVVTDVAYTHDSAYAKVVFDVLIRGFNSDTWSKSRSTVESLEAVEGRVAKGVWRLVK